MELGGEYECLSDPNLKPARAHTSWTRGKRMQCEKDTDNLFIQKFNCIKSNQTICIFTFSSITILLLFVDVPFLAVPRLALLCVCMCLCTVIFDFDSGIAREGERVQHRVLFLRETFLRTQKFFGPTTFWLFLLWAKAARLPKTYLS